MVDTKLAIILLAGESKRLRPLTNNMPKCLLEVSGITILENMLIMLHYSGCNRVKLVVGYKSDRIKKLIGKQNQCMSIEYIDNEMFDITNSMYSLRMGLKGVNEPVWVIEGDIFLQDNEIFKLKTEDDIGWFVDSSMKDVDGAYVKDDGNKYAKDLNIIRDVSTIQPDQYKSMGILHFNQSGVEKVKSWLDEGVRDKLYNVYYDVIMEKHIKDENIKLVDAAGNKWCEIDTIADLEYANRTFHNAECAS
jgi:L-glutamine-phosphate cytidylyltransferase